MERISVGIDVSKDTLDVVIRQADCNGKAKSFSNDAKGIRALLHWLPKVPVEQLHACLEATGDYGTLVAELLYAQHIPVSVINPLAVKRYAGSSLIRNQTDQVDAGILAEFCDKKHPRQWIPPSPTHKALRSLSRRLEDLQGMLQMERNRLQASRQLEPAVRESIQTLIQQLTEQIQTVKAQMFAKIDADPELKRQQKLLMSIKGIGKLTATRFLAELGDLRDFASAKQLAAFLGLTPEFKTSGSSVRSKPRLSKKGPAQVRQFLYMPAVVAKNHNPIVQAFCARLEKARKSDLAIVAAAMHKLVHLMFGVVHSGLPFDPNFLYNSHLPS